MALELSGIVVTPITPFTPTLEIDEDALQDLARYFMSVKGINGILCNAHAAEGSTMTREERMRCIRIFRDEVKGRVPVMSMVEAYGTQEVIHLIEDAREAGAEGVMVCPPPIYSWHARRSPEVAIAFWHDVCQAVDLPLILFQFYTGSQHSYTHETMVQIVRENENIVGVKMAHGNEIVRYMEDAWALRALDRRVAIMPASGILFYTQFLIEADGAVTGFANFAAEDLVDLFEAVKADDLARARQLEKKIRPLAGAIEADPFFYMHQRYKEAAWLLGRIPNPLVRPPSLPISEEEREALRQALEEMGLLKTTRV